MNNIDKTYQRLMAEIEKLKTPPYAKLGKKFDDWTELKVKRDAELMDKYEDYYPPYSLEKARALFNEAHPTGDPEVDTHWKLLREMMMELDPFEVIWDSWGVCPECGWEGILHEIGLTPTCDNPKCVETVSKWYEDWTAFHSKLRATAKEDFAAAHPSVRKIIKQRAKDKGTPVLQEWVGALEGFVDVLQRTLNISIEDARSKIPELIMQLKSELKGDLPS